MTRVPQPQALFRERELLLLSQFSGRLGVDLLQVTPELLLLALRLLLLQLVVQL